MNTNKNLKEICEKQKKSINKWNREISNRLTMNSMINDKRGYEMPLFIIDKDKYSISPSSSFINKILSLSLI